MSNRFWVDVIDNECFKGPSNQELAMEGETERDRGRERGREREGEVSLHVAAVCGM